MKIFILDFFDSFTHNIFSDLKSLGYDSEIIEPEDHINFLDKFIPGRGLIILGPGPGSAKVHFHVIAKVKELIGCNQPVFGICLGHQIIGETFDMTAERCYEPKHGQIKTLKLDQSFQDLLGLTGQSIDVQAYNSLCIKADDKNKKILKNSAIKFITHNNEVEIMRGQKFLSFQFHPESVGTSYRKALFSGVIQYLL